MNPLVQLGTKGQRSLFRRKSRARYSPAGDVSISRESQLQLWNKLSLTPSVLPVDQGRIPLCDLTPRDFKHIKRPCPLLKLLFKPKVIVLTNTREKLSPINTYASKYSLENSLYCHIRSDGACGFGEFLEKSLANMSSHSTLVFLHYKIRTNDDNVVLLEIIDEIQSLIESLEHSGNVRVEACIRTNKSTYAKFEKHFRDSGTVSFIVDNEIEDRGREN